MSFAKYQFLSWARRGISTQISEADTLGVTPGTQIERATLEIGVAVNGSLVPIAGEGDEQAGFLLLGPGDITGIKPEMVIRTSPLNLINDFEPNLLPYVEFYDEDFPWRYTPASATGDQQQHLRPWLALIVLTETEFVDTDRHQPLPSIRLLNPGALPPPDQLHLWAHMHSNKPLEVSEFADFIRDLGDKVRTDPDGVYSRLLCPRRLAPRTLYHAFLIPSYETGRLAGLGRSPRETEVPAQQPSWPNAEQEFPVYYRWQFRTGENYDFESLVKLLEPRIMDKRVGTRPMDCSRPGFVQADVNEVVAGTDPPVLLLEGALKSPSAESTVFPPPDTPQPFTEQLEKLVNLNRLQEVDEEQDPVVSAPFYAMYHAMRKDETAPGKRAVPEFDRTSDAWYNDLNRDPRHRVPAGFGVRVLQENQEKFMDLAWKQLRDVLEANRQVNRTKFAMKVNERLYRRHLETLPEEDLLALTYRMTSRIRVAAQTLRSQITGSIVPNAVFTPTFRKMTRPKNSVIRTLSRQTETRAFHLQPFVQRINRIDNGITAAAITAFEALPAIAQLETIQVPPSLNNVAVWTFQSNLDTTYLFSTAGFNGGLPAAIFWDNYFQFDPGAGGVIVINPGGGVIDTGGGAIDPGLINIPDISVIGGLPPVGPLLRSRSLEFTYELAYQDLAARFDYAEVVTPPVALEVPASHQAILDRIEPATAFRKLFEARVKWPDNIASPAGEELLPAVAYPDIPDPTYKYLVDIDEDLLLPNLKLIPQNTLSLLRTNQKFIESYLIGLNYEMGRELLWREFPTDMRGSYFRQFWDVRGLITPDSTPADADALKDIEPIHLWELDSRLGDHNARDEQGDPEQLVFVVRGDLLKKFPNTVIYAQKAIPHDTLGKGIQENFIDEADELDAETFQRSILFPQYQADLPPDIKLLGFDLTIEQAAGLEPSPGFAADDQLGWFFIIAEVPGEPAFGMDIYFSPSQPDEESDGATHTWNDLSWENFGEAPLPFINRDVPPGSPFVAPTNSAQGQWGRSSADMAAILMQRPVMVAVHATEMLDVEVPDETVPEQPVKTILHYIRHLPLQSL